MKSAGRIQPKRQKRCLCIASEPKEMGLKVQILLKIQLEIGREIC
jgi:hypothetical protein